MRKLFILLIVVFIYNDTIFSQIYYDFNTNIQIDNWIGDTNDFDIINQQLHLNAPSISSSKKIFVNSNQSDSIWYFDIFLDFNTSSSNYADIILYTTDTSLQSDYYFVRIGYSNDDISLYKHTGNSNVKLIDGYDNILNQNQINVRIKVKYNNNQWQLYSDTSQLYNNIELQGTYNDNFIFSNHYFGINCIYTSTRSDKFYFDNISIMGNEIIDSISPKVNDVIVNLDTVKIIFDEKIQNNSILIFNNILINSYLAINNEIVFNSNNINSGSNTLLITNTTDLYNNLINDTTIIFYGKIIENIKYKELLITELMFDPEPIIYLPNCEYIEIYNNSQYAVNLQNIEISDKSNSIFLPNKILPPNEYIIVIEENYTSYFPNTNILSVSSIPSLNNDIDKLQIKKDGNIIDEVTYNINRLNEKAKSSGGWSIELINNKINCFSHSNWKYSTNPKGGSPSSRNNNYDTNYFLNINANIIEKYTYNDQLILIFDYDIDSANIDISDIESSFQSDFSIIINNDSIKIIFDQVMDTGILYNLKINNLKTCMGDDSNHHSEFVLPNDDIFADLKINEILFNPKPNCNDFVEIYNNSDKYISLLNWNLANGNSNTYEEVEKININRIIYPREYIVLTENRENIISNYIEINTHNIFEMKNLPSYNDDSGTIYLMRKNFEIEDKFSYTKQMHSIHLRDDEGISLERISIDANTQSQSNWHSASELVGFATPAIENSMANKYNLSSNIWNISTDVISPNSDTENDFLIIEFNIENKDAIANIEVFNKIGIKTSNILANSLISNKYQIKWEGTDYNHNILPIGNYILLLTLIDNNGNTFVDKKVISIIY